MTPRPNIDTRANSNGCFTDNHSLLGVDRDDEFSGIRNNAKPTIDDSKRSRQLHQQQILEFCEEKLMQSKESQRIVKSIKELYKNKILPLEKYYHLHSLCMPSSGRAIQDADFDARPMVLLMGQYSTGKTTFIRHLLGVDFPGMHIGPEPTTDKFMALIHGHDHKLIKGNTLTVMPEMPFFGLSQFGSSFLNHFDGSVTDSALLEFMNVIDTPGILSGEKQRLSREYDFSQTAQWFADRADLILLLFDSHKLDISDEFKEVVETIRPHNDDKIRCVLNKADSVEKEQMVRVYGSLLWSMGKIFRRPEVVRVYTGSFWEKPLVHNDFRDMFQADEESLLDELMRLPSVASERKVNRLVRRVRLIKVHVCLLGYLRQQMPRWFGCASKRQQLLANLDQVFEIVRNLHGLSRGDMPNVSEFHDKLDRAFGDFRALPVLNNDDITTLDEILETELPSIMRGGTNVTDVHAVTSDCKHGEDEAPGDKPTFSKSKTPVRTEKASGSGMSFFSALFIFIQVLLNLVFFIILGCTAYIMLMANVIDYPY